VGIELRSQGKLSLSGSNLFLNDDLNLDNRSTETVSATGSFWGSSDSDAIEETIEHQADDINLGLVDFSGFLSSADSGVPLSPVSQVLKSEQGGDVKLEWTIPAGDVVGFIVQTNPDANGDFQTRTDVGLVSEYVVAGGSLGDAFGVSFYTSDADGVDDVLEGYESWYALAEEPAPLLTLRPMELDFGISGLGLSKNLEVVISNPGTAELNVSSIVSDAGDFSVSPNSVTVAVRGEETVTVSFSPSSTGVQEASLSFVHDAVVSPSSVGLLGYGFVGTSGFGAKGIIVSDTTWTLADSPVYVLGDVQVPSGVTLTIEAGVEVLFTGGYEILMQGVVLIEGTEGSPVSFGSSTGSSVAATGLKFIGTDLGGSSIDWLSFSGLDTAIRIGEESEHDQGGKNTGELVASNLSVTNGLILTDGYDTLASLRLEDVVFFGATVRGAYPRSEPIAIVGGEIVSSEVNSDSYNKGISLESVEVSDSEFRMGCCGANLTLTDCVVRDSSFSDYNNYYNVTIESSLLTRTPISLAQSNGVTISDSQLVFAGTGGVIAKDLTMTNSSVIGGDVGLALSGDSSVSGSLVTQCRVGIELRSQGKLSLSGSNLFLNDDLNLDNRSTETVSATGSFWGGLLESVIEKTLQHRSDDLNLGLVDFSGFLLTPDENPPLSPILVVQEVAGEGGSRELYWSRTVESGAVGYQISLFDDVLDIVPQLTIDVGDSNTYSLGAEHQGKVIGVSAYKADPDTGDKLLDPNVEGWPSLGESVLAPDWFEIHMQPYLDNEGPIINPLNRNASFRILSWILPPVVQPGQEVESSLLIEYTDEVHPINDYDRDELVSFLVSGDWNLAEVLSDLVSREGNGEPRIEQYLFSFVAPLDPDDYDLRFSSSFGGDVSDHYYGENDLSKIGPYSEIGFSVVEKNSPPATPLGLFAVGGATSIYLPWDANTESNLLGYHIYRGTSEDAASMTRITDEVVVLNEYLDYEVSHFETYFYRVVAVNTNEDESEFSDAATTTVSKIIMSMDDFVGAPGGAVSLFISAENATGVSGNGLDVRVTYDKDLLEAVTVEKTSLTESFQIVDNASVADGQVNVSAVSLDGSLIQGRGALLELKFEVKDDAEIGSIGEHVFTDVRLYDATLSQLAVDFSDTAEFLVSNKYKLGDVSGNGEVDSLDALMALQHSAGLRTLQPDSPEFRAGDLNKDGVIDSSDVILIQELAVLSSAEGGDLVAVVESKVFASQAFHVMSSNDGYEIKMPTIGGLAGDIIQVPVEVRGPAGIAGVDLGIVYDPLVLKLLSMDRGGNFDGYTLQSDYRQGSPSISIAKVGDGSIALSGSVDMSFEIVGSAGDVSPLRIVRQKIVRSSGEDVSLGGGFLTHINGSVSVIVVKIDDWINEELSGYSSVQKRLDADPDSDGRSNLAEYAFGLDPTGFDSLPLDPLVVDETMSFSVTVRSDDPMLTIVCLVSDDLVNWSSSELEFDSDQSTWSSALNNIGIDTYSEVSSGMWKLEMSSLYPGGSKFVKFEIRHDTGSPAAQTTARSRQTH
jgi:hypothetical protein